MALTYDQATGTYSNGMRIGDIVNCRWGEREDYGEGIVTPPPLRIMATPYGIYADWRFKDRPKKTTNGYMFVKDVYPKAPIEVLGDNDDDCV